ncbi:MAG: DNA-3-methyladenine glycosylase [Herpetosiphonaceae bacterium]|nr:DNA-3-methyladenine glycosylase [Herpetosiphonaceae bacterium]
MHAYPPPVLPASFYQRHSLTVARDLLGCRLVRRLPDGAVLSGRIVETEAYTPDDPSCHAHRGESPRARSMFQAGGIAYVYLIYGMYHCLNVVTQAASQGAAVLIRAIEPLDGVDRMADARGISSVRDLARGPGRLCQSFQIDRALDGTCITATDCPLWIQSGEPLPDVVVAQTPRIGINVSPAAIAAPWRLIVRENGFVSGTSRQNQGQSYTPTPDWFDRL